MTTSVPSLGAIGRSPAWVPPESPATAFWGRLLVAVVALVWVTTIFVDFRDALTVLMAIGFAVAALGLRYPILGLFGIGILCTVNEIAAPLLLSGGLWRWNTVNYWLLLMSVLFLPSLLSLRQAHIRALVAFMVLLALEILLSPGPREGMQDVLAVGAVFGLLIYFRRAVLDPTAWYWLGVVVGVAAAGGTTAFVLQRDALPFVNQNVWSYVPVTAMLTICLASVGIGDAPRRRLVLAVLAMINGVWAFLSGSRGSLLVAVVCLAFLLALMTVRRALMFGAIAALVSVAILSHFTTLEDHALSRLRLLVDSRESISTRTSARFDLALGGWYIFKDHPLGVGTGGFQATWRELGPRQGLSRGAQVRWVAAHSAWIKVLAENGLPGILLLVAYVVAFAVSGWRSRDPELLKLGLLVSAVLAVAWVSTEFQNKALWFLAAGATVLFERRSR